VIKMPKGKKRLTQETMTRTIDGKTGEVMFDEHSQTTVIINEEPDYVKLYVNTILTFKSLPVALNPILLELLRLMSYAEEGQIITYNDYWRKQIADKTQKKPNTIDKALGDLTNSGIFKRIARGTYQVNPNIFGKGSWDNIKELRAKFDFKAGKIEQDFVYSTENNEQNPKKTSEQANTA